MIDSDGESQTQGQPDSGSSIWNRWLGLDFRALACLRMAYGFVILLDSLIRCTDLNAHYTDWGAVPRNMTLELDWSPEYWSLHMINGSAPFQLLLFAINILFAIMLLLGYRTRLATLVCWILMVSLHNRNPMILDGGDIYQRVIMFWALFLPWGMRWSLDSLRSQSHELPQRWLGPSSVAYIAQLTMLYSFSGFLKTDPVWVEKHTAVYSALCIEQLTTPRAYLLLQHPDLMKFLTVATLQFERYGPILLWIPGPLRLLGALGISCMHLGFGTFMHLGVFALTGMLTPIGLLPSFVWNFLERRPAFQRLQSWITHKAELLLARLPGENSASALSPEPWNYRRGWLNWMVILGLTFYCYLWNLTTLTGSRVQLRSAISIGRFLRLDQRWNMFSPKPLEEDGWYVIDARRLDGTHFDLFGAYFGESPDLTWNKPHHVASTFPNARWRKLMMNYWSRDLSAWRMGFGRYLTRRWNGSHRGSEQIAAFKLYFVREDTDMSGADIPTTAGLTKPVEKVELWNHQCFDSPIPQMVPSNGVVTPALPGNITTPGNQTTPASAPSVSKTP
jgi:hypothetical protein